MATAPFTRGVHRQLEGYQKDMTTQLHMVLTDALDHKMATTRSPRILPFRSLLQTQRLLVETGQISHCAPTTLLRVETTVAYLRMATIPFTRGVHRQLEAHQTDMTTQLHMVLTDALDHKMMTTKYL
jgi:hypothetical protein